MEQRDPLTEQIIGCAIEVHRHMGAGLLERAYALAMRLNFNRPVLREGIKRFVL